MPVGKPVTHTNSGAGSSTASRVAMSDRPDTMRDAGPDTMRDADTQEGRDER
jgi:hypothetical protein